MNIDQLIKELKKQRAIAVARGINPKRVTVNVHAQDDPTGKVWEEVEWAELRPCTGGDVEWLLCLNVPPIKPRAADLIVKENKNGHLKLIGGQPK